MKPFGSLGKSSMLVLPCYAAGTIICVMLPSYT